MTGSDSEAGSGTATTSRWPLILGAALILALLVGAVAWAASTGEDEPSSNTTLPGSTATSSSDATATDPSTSGPSTSGELLSPDSLLTGEQISCLLERAQAEGLGVEILEGGDDAFAAADRELIEDLFAECVDGAEAGSATE